MKIGLPSLLFITFLVLKLTHVIDWSWVWISAPLWGGFALFLIISAGILGLGMLVIWKVEKKK